MLGRFKLSGMQTGRRRTRIDANRSQAGEDNAKDRARDVADDIGCLGIAGGQVDLDQLDRGA